MRPTREIIDLHVTKRAEEESNTGWQAHLWYGYQREEGGDTSEAIGRFLNWGPSQSLPAFLQAATAWKPPPSMNIIIIIPFEHVCSHLFSYSFLVFSTTLRVHNTHLFLTNLSDSLMAVSSPTTTAWRAHCLLTVTHLLWPWCTGDRLL
jgi:hypothetical protein